MEITQEEIDKIIFKVTESVLLRMPEVIGNLMRNHAENNKLVKKFYESYPDFKSDPLSVQSVVQKTEQDNPGVSYDKILEKAAPLIKKRIQDVKGLNFDSIKESTDLDLNIDLTSSGEI